jgi:hypothetical protein
VVEVEGDFELEMNNSVHGAGPNLPASDYQIRIVNLGIGNTVGGQVEEGVIREGWAQFVGFCVS